MSEKPYISASQLGMLELCPESYRRRYIEGEKIPPGFAMLRGTGVHGGAKANFRQKKDSRIDLPEKDIVEIAVTAFDAQLGKSGASLTAEEEAIGFKKVAGTTRDSVASLAGLFTREVAPEYQPILVEEKQRIVIPDAPYDILGILDLADEQERIADLKTSEKKKPETEVANSEALSIYALIYKALTGRLPKDVRLEVLVDKAKPERQCLVGSRDMADLEVLVRRINAALALLKSGVFIPCAATSWKCNPKWCGYHPTCPYVRKGGGR